ncbi:hypothetical protein BJF81_06720 [Ornithinimicrobium sp. CNJ-824]|uniref:copper resistance CopC family protein n=1 Tax=Ornithinimicrobiaceae TaxID=2805590 RepID=UPI0009604C07|nr:MULTISPECIES: copper resistance protein CopC [Ornithinimicrobiaceae]OLT18036.1 hypothetical protein BJF80_01725 [Serinicoccus sp. CUA-874]OLT20063.1 hypothetical protein BJF81_06720 [Ornithinimicrobium sp. CNJ-824]
MLRLRAPFLALLLTCLLVVPVGASSAHDELTATEPVDGSTVEAPEELVLTFSGRLSDLGAQVTVSGPDGQSVVDGGPEVTGTKLEQELVDDLPAGDYAVVWRVTSEDGHPISGELGFTVEQSTEDATAEAEPSTEAEAAPTSEAEPSTQAEPTAAAGDDAASEASEGATNSQEVPDGGGLPVWAWTLVALGAIGVLGLLARTWTRGRE